MEKKKLEIDELREELIKQEEFINYSRYFLMNLSEIWLNSEFDKKRKFQELLFPEGIHIENNKFRTPKINPVLSLIKAQNKVEIDYRSQVAAPSCEISNRFLKDLKIIIDLVDQSKQG